MTNFKKPVQSILIDKNRTKIHLCNSTNHLKQKDQQFDHWAFKIRKHSNKRHLPDQNPTGFFWVDMGFYRRTFFNLYPNGQP